MRIIAVFHKIDGARHISHLDLMRAVQRALRRAGLPVRYSKGFNPHMVLSFASALSLGFTSVGEVMDVAMEEEVSLEEFECAMGRELPPALALVEAHAVPDGYPGLMGLVRSVDYRVALAGPASLGEEALYARFQEAFKTPLEVEKKSKAGPKRIDVRSQVLRFEPAGAEGGAPAFFLRCSAAKEGTLNPRTLFDALRAACALDFEADYCRLALWADEEGRVPLWRAEEVLA